MPTDDRTRDIRHWTAMRLLRVASPTVGDVEAAVAWALSIDAALTGLGYGADGAPAPTGPAPLGPEPPGTTAPATRRGRPRKSAAPSAWDSLPPASQADLERCRAAYRLPTDREGAAATWAALDPDPATVEQIIAAAARDARGCSPDGRQRADGSNRPWLARWLRDRRWQDGASVPAAGGGVKVTGPSVHAVLRDLEVRRQGLVRQIEALEALGADVPEALREQLAAVESRLAEVLGAP